MARVNVELKGRDSDPDATAARCLALGASDEGVLQQRDTYFPARRGRLKLRDLGRPDSDYQTVRLGELLPLAFGREELEA